MMNDTQKLVVNTASIAEQTVMESVVMNLAGKVRHDTLEGRPFIVAPVVMLKRGVVAGSNGPLLYKDEELSKTPAVWNCKPVVVYHPQANGKAVSACDPIVMSGRKIGILLNTSYDRKSGKLKSECWMEVERLKAVDERVLNALEQGTVMEVSTGLFTDNVSEEGEYDGKPYTAIATNFRPDHLAILPDQVGACSVADGAGLLQNSQPISPDQLAIIRSFVGNETSHDEVRQELNQLIRKPGNDALESWTLEVYDAFFIFERKGKLHKQDYEVKDDVVRLVGVAVRVDRVVKYQLPDGTFVGNQRKEQDMNKKQKVDALISNKATAWSEEDRDALMAMDDKALDKMTPVANTEPAPVQKKDDEEEEKVVPAAAPVTPPAANAKPQSLDEFIANAPAEMQDVLRSGVEAHNIEKGKLISTITTNKANVLTPEYLKSRTLAELKGIAALAAQPQQTTNSRLSPIYTGQGDPAAPATNVEEPLAAPAMSFSK